MNTIPSPYNFVPLSKHVFFPEWSDRVSMDVPFSDGISGTLEIKVTARSPVYIRNGGDHPDDAEQRRNDPGYSDFFRAAPGGPYAIPGTSIKGMLRSVIEIITFSKIAGTKGQASRVSDHRYAMRDLYNSDYTSKITEITGRGYRPKVRAAWLTEGKENDWNITLCDFARVEQEDLERHFNLGNNSPLGRRGPAKEKYALIPPYTEMSFTCGDEESHKHSRGTNLVYRKAEKLGTGNKKGTIVLTGQPAPRDGRPGKKHMEFIFFDDQDSPIPVPDQVKKDFDFAHSELGENRKPNTEWSFWKEKLRHGNKIPVFVLIEGHSIHSMGLALMYRFPYTNSILETVAHTSADHLEGNRLDFGETLFGRVEDTDAFRGRVSVETLTAQGDPVTLENVDTILGAPKPTFYPNYIRQKTDEDGALKSGKYDTYMDDRAEIRGWKRYIIRNDGVTEPVKPESEQEKVSTRFKPLPAGTSFLGTVHVHNLKPAELGALVWALTWGGEADLRHSLGMAKPYGYGAVTVSIAGNRLKWCDPRKEQDPDVVECMKTFTEKMNSWYANTGESQTWEKCDALAALKAMANPRSAWNHELRYPVIGRGSRENEFANSKNKNQNEGKVLSLLPPIPAKPQKPKPEKQAVQQKRELTTIDKFLAELDGGVSVKKIPERLKAYGLSPSQVSEADKKRICDRLQQMKKKMGFNQQLEQVITKWK
jgi:CRISPR-associated protein (TIGR03986 family)